MAKKVKTNESEFSDYLKILDEINPKKSELKIKTENGELVEIQAGVTGVIVDSNEAIINSLFGGEFNDVDKDRIAKLAYIMGITKTLKSFI